MSHLPFTILAYMLNAVAVTVDKFLITKKIPDPLVYTFYMSVVSVITLVLIPFAHLPTSTVFILASTSTILWTIGAYFMFKSLQVGQVSRVIPIIGSLVPLILLVESIFTQTLNLNEIWAIIILLVGLIFLTLNQLKGELTSKEILFEVLSSVFFAISYLFLRQAYLQADFWTVFVWARPILIPVGLLLLAIPTTRKIIFPKKASSKNNAKSVISSNPILALFKSPAGLFFVIAQVSAGVSELLLTYSVSLANPALVNSLQGTQFAFLFVLNIILSKRFPDVFKEKLSPAILICKILGLLLIGGGLFILAFAKTDHNKSQLLGVTFSPRYALELGINPHDTFDQMIYEMGVQNVRFPLYWDEIETSPQVYDFESADEYLTKTQAKNVQVILVVGYKQPRWPECFTPTWAKKLTESQKTAKILELVKQEVNHFKKYPNIKAWQVENEPFLSFGKCEPVTQKTKARLQEEVNLVKSLDSRPILITDSGELSTWRKSYPIADWFGTTLYRSVWNPIFGSAEYPIPPLFYQAKAYLAHKFTSNHVTRNIVAELQAEPWAPAKTSIANLSLEDQRDLFPAIKIAKNVTFAKQTGFDEIYLWGVEWWYYMKQKGDSEYTTQAQELFQNY